MAIGKHLVKSVNHVNCLSEREQITVVQKYVASILINKAQRAIKRKGDDKIKSYMRTDSRHSNAIETKSQNIAIMQHTTNILSKKKNTPIEVGLNAGSKFPLIPRYIKPKILY